jgi:hypothetical protein
MKKRATQKVEIDLSTVKSGDYFAIFRLDGLGALIMYGTGSHAGHTAMALEIDDVMYVVESQDAPCWPTKHIQRTPLAKWLEQAENADYNVAHLPLRDEYRQKFDVQNAIDFFLTVEGLPYGYHNFLYGWLDTAHNNWPPLLADEFIPVMFSIVEKIAPKVAYNFFTEALNKRLGVDGKNIAEIAALAASKNMEIEDVIAMVEQDGWEYTGEEPRDGRSYVCSAFVAAVWKAGGIWGDMEINATEFGPGDIYKLDIFEKNPKLPEQCVAADPDLPYCQLLGKYKFEMPGFSSVPLYAHMNEKCSINWPSYSRDDGC